MPVHRDEEGKEKKSERLVEKADICTGAKAGFGASELGR